MSCWAKRKNSKKDEVVAKIIECVPNISEGRNQQVIDEIVGIIKACPGVTFLDLSSDTSHNRSVLTFIGEPEPMENAVLAMTEAAIRLIDLRKHRGQHPRMGAVDVIPFIPIKEMDMQECVDFSKRVGNRLWQKYQLPVFLYEASATRPGRQNLADIRRGEFEGMTEKMTSEEWKPDYGDSLHPSAGAVAVGAREALIAFNINLSTSNVEVAKAIAKTIRTGGGGLSCVKALGIFLEERNLAQVSINMTNYKITPLYRVVELVRAEAKRWGVHVLGTEIVGLAPMDALVDSAEYYLQIENFNKETQVLEKHLL